MAIRYVEARVDQVVSDGDGESEFDDKTSFYDRLLAYVTALEPDEWFYVQYIASPSGALEMTVGVSGVRGEAEKAKETEDELFNLLSTSDSPLIMPRANIIGAAPRAGRGDRAKGPDDEPRAWFLRRSAITDAANTRLFPVELTALKDGFQNSITCILAKPGTVLRVMIRQAAEGIEALRALLADRESGVIRTEDLSRNLSREGLPVEIEFVAVVPEASLPRSLSAALKGLANGLELTWSRASAREITAALDSRSPLGPGIGISPQIMFKRESLALLRLPAPRTGSFPGLNVVPSQLARVGFAVPDGSAANAICLGRALDASGLLRSVSVRTKDLDRHMYVPGQTGAGKSTFLRGLAYEIAKSGEGLLFIDPHGNTVERLVGELPRNRARDVVYVDAADVEAAAPINPFAVTDALQRDTAMENVTAMFQDLFDPHQQGIIGPRWETWFRMGMTTLLEAYGERASMLAVPSLFFDDEFLRACKAKVQNKIVRDFWDKEMAKTTQYHISEVLGWFSSKFTAFRMNSVLNAVLGTGWDVLNPSQIMDEGKIILVSLSKGEIGAPVTQLLGYVYLTRFWTAALRRKTPRPFTVIVDEAQSFTKGSLPAMLSEGRKFGLRVVMANQYLGQLPEDLRSAVLGNVGNVVALRLGAEDAESLGARFAPEFEPRALRLMPNFVGAASLLADGRMVPGFSVMVDYEERVMVKERQLQAQVKSVRHRSSLELRRSYLKAQAEARMLHETIRNGATGLPPEAAPSGGQGAMQMMLGAEPGTFVDGWRIRKDLPAGQPTEFGKRAGSHASVVGHVMGEEGQSAPTNVDRPADIESDDADDVEGMGM